jgi:competence ComEA-like helix-hairpin-helix protein
MLFTVSTDNFIRQTDSSQNKVQSFAFCLALSGAVFGAFLVAVLGVGKCGPQGEIRIESRINPNCASRASLRRLPGIGAGRAEAIVAYREEFLDKEHPFKGCDDLQKVRGIGPKTAADICEWLKFE